MEDGGGGGDWFGDPGVHGASSAYDGMEGFVLPSPVLQHSSPVLQLTPPSPPRPESEKWWTSQGMTSQNDPMSHYLYNGVGLSGLELVDNNYKVDEMLVKYASTKKLVLTVMKDNRKRAIVLSPLKRKHASTIDLDPEEEEPIAHPFLSQDSSFCDGWQSQMDHHNFPQMHTQESVNCEKGKHVLGLETCMAEEEEEESEDEDDSWLYPGRFDPIVAEKARRDQEEEMHQRIAARKKSNLDPMLHCEGESDVEDIYDNATRSEDISTIPAVKRQVKRPGPTLRSHSQLEADVIPDWVPSDDEGDKGFLKEEDDDGYEPLPFVLAGGRKSRGKMAKERVWYDDSRQNPEQQFMVGLCFKDVYQFRQALARLHIVQVRNFHYHRNTPDRIIVWCKDKQKKNNEENVKEKEKKCIVTTVTGPTDEQVEAMKKGQMVNISYSPRFHGLFFCVNAAREGFLQGCRPFIGLDGCFIKLTSGAQILAATGRDGNNNIYPIAWGVVAKEDTENWQWFLEQLKQALGGEHGQFGYYTMMSDRQKGLLKAVSTVFPNSPQRYCLRHIYANFQTAGFRGEDLKKCMDNAAYSYTKDGFDEAMEEMKKQSEEAWNWLSKIPVEAWARFAMDTNCQTDLVANRTMPTADASGTNVPASSSGTNVHHVAPGNAPPNASRSAPGTAPRYTARNAPGNAGSSAQGNASSSAPGNAGSSAPGNAGRSAPVNARGLSGYFNAGANAGPGRDASDPPLQGRN
ncbi:hypothetical protein QYE76_061849 [Lolium multiflorum]|uniref:MULE transposase domain-containing protein n=1 Tax=Lolium multiflorum TaxID=4521 RepID=A0AAD8W7L2_LOLMU|nr:hypothetical protein QYE76_061849 [Lolium multiflorum]